MNSKRSPFGSSQLQRSSSSKRQKMVSEPCPNEMTQQHDLVVAVKTLHRLSSRALGLLIRHAENGIMRWTETTESFEINVEFFTRNLVSHIMKHFRHLVDGFGLSPKQYEEQFRYVLGGLRLLHTLFAIASEHATVTRVLVGDREVRTEIIDSVFDMVIILSQLDQKLNRSRRIDLLYAALLSNSMHLITALMSSDLQLVVRVLNSHHKLDEFTIAAFTAVHVIVGVLRRIDSRKKSNANEVYCLFHHCEASLLFIQSLCKQLLFRERLVKNKDLCGGGVVLQLVLTTLKLSQCEDPCVTDLVSRLKSKVLSIMLHLCEAQSASFWNMATSTKEGMDLAVSTISEVLGVLKNTPKGILHINAMELAAIFSEDSRLRTFVIMNLAEFLAGVFLQREEKFLSTWCSDDLEPAEEDIVAGFDPISAAGQVLGLPSMIQIKMNSCNNFQVLTPEAHRRSSLLVEIIANLACFVPDLFAADNALFVNEFLKCLQTEISTLPRVAAAKTATASRNLARLLAHAESSTSASVNEQDVNVLRWVVKQVEESAKEVQNSAQCASPTPPNTVLTIRGPNPTQMTSSNIFKCKVGQRVVLTDKEGEEIGTGTIHLVRGVWFERNLERLGLCAVDVDDLKVPKEYPLPHPVDAMITFQKAEHILQKMRILWDSSQLFLS